MKAHPRPDDDDTDRVHPHDEHAEHEDELVTLNEVAELLRVPPATLRYWRYLGTGPASFRIGRHVRYYREDIDTWLRDQRQAGRRAAG